MDGAGGRQFTAIKMECLYPNHTGIEFGVRFQEFLQRAVCDIMATRKGDVRMPWAKIGFEPDGERGILYSFVKLKEMWMTRTDADPNNFYRAFGRKCPDPFNRQKESAKLNRAQFFPQLEIDLCGHIGKKAESEMHLIARHPARATDMRVETNQRFFNRRWQIDRNKKTFKRHFSPPTSAPGRASSPFRPACDGRNPFTILVTRAARLGKSALAATTK